MYRGYTVRAALNEYALTFFTMLSAGRRQIAQEQMVLLNIVSSPHLESQDRSELIERMQSAAFDPDLMEIDSDDYSGIDSLRGLLGE